MKLNITQIAEKLRSNNACHVSESDLKSDMEVIMNVNKTSYNNKSGSLAPSLVSYYESGSTDLIEFAEVFLTTLLHQPITLVSENGIISINPQ